MDALTRARQFWAERQPRERQVLAAGAAFLALLLCYLLLIDPALTGIARLQRLLPQTRAQAGELEALVGEAKRLRAQPPVAAPGAGDARAALYASLDAAGLVAARNAPLSNGDLRLSFANVPYARWATWLVGAERTLGVHAVAVSVKATATPGNTDIELSVRLPRA